MIMILILIFFVMVFVGKLLKNYYLVETNLLQGAIASVQDRASCHRSKILMHQNWYEAKLAAYSVIKA
jgi:hypothetical protein